MLKLDLSPNGKAGNSSTRGHPSHVNYVERKPKPHRPHRSSRRHFRHGERAAVIRAITAAKLRLDGTFPSLVMAATACGSNPAYVRAAIVLLKAENLTLVHRVSTGHVGLLEAARDVGRLADLMKAYRTSTIKDHVAFARFIGADVLFDNMVVPAL